MPESISHRYLVKELASFIARNYAQGNLSEVYIETDERIGRGKPPIVNNHTPDAYFWKGEDVEVVGEAKPASDTHSPRSLLQLKSFVEYAASRPHCVMVIAAPWHCVASVSNTILNICRRNGCKVTYTVIDGLGDEPIS